MRYDLSLMEAQIIATLQANSGLTGVYVDTHAGQITALYFQDPILKEGLIKRIPFVFVQYQGKRKTQEDSTRSLTIHELTFRFFTGAQSLRKTRESQTSCYGLLSSIYDALHGKAFKYTGNNYTYSQMSGTSMTTSEFNQQEPMMESDTVIEQLIVNLPDIAVYQTDYICKVLA